MTTKDIGDFGEKVAVDYLIAQGYKILDRNWKNRFCEIDIITSKNGITYFVEVKYRKNDTFGDGVDAITEKKLKQMQFAANLWVSSKKYTGDYRLLVVAVSPDNIDCIEL